MASESSSSRPVVCQYSLLSPQNLAAASPVAVLVTESATNINTRPSATHYIPKETNEGAADGREALLGRSVPLKGMREAVHVPAQELMASRCEIPRK